MIITGLDRRITIQIPTEAKDSYGGVVKTWSMYAVVSARVKPIRGDELFKSQQMTAKIDSVFTIRWMAGITEKMRIAYDGKNYGIRSIIELGRREGLEIYAEVEQ